MTPAETPPAPAVTNTPLARRVLDALPLTIYAVDLEGRITAANNAWSQFAQSNGAADLASEQQLLGQSIFSAVAEPGARKQLDDAMSLLRTQQVPTVRWEFPCSSPEEERIFLMHISALREAGEVTGFVFSTVDISASHRTREALIETGIALSHAIDVARVYEEVSRQVRRVVPSTGVVIAVAQDAFSAPEIVHRWGFTDEENRGELQARLMPAWGEALATQRVRLRQLEGHLEFTVPLIGSEGGIGAITLAPQSLDSTQQIVEAERVFSVIAAQTAVAIERTRLVQRVEQKRRLEAIGEVAAGVAHELRNPLFGISSAAQLLRFLSSDDPVVEKNVARILREVDRLSNMVTSMLDFGRPATAQLEPGDPEAVWDEVLESEAERLVLAKVTLRRSRPALPVRCLIDPAQFKQVYLNILGNALDAAPPDTELVLESTVLANGGWRCRLCNGGPAIAADVLPHVFEFFFSAKAGGTGIGLALCQRIMAEHRGTIAIASSPERGTTLTLTLPAPAAT